VNDWGFNMTIGRLYDKEHAIKRLDYIKGLNYTGKEYKKNMRRHTFKYKTKAHGLLNTRLTAKQELVLFESYGFDNLKQYAIDVLEQNIEYCTVLELKTHDAQINKTIEFLEKSNNREYLLTLKDFATKNSMTWLIPMDRLINWIDCYMIQREVFFSYATLDDGILFVPNYFTDNVLFMSVVTDNEDEDYEADLDLVCECYDRLVKGISEILRNLPEDRLIEDLFNITPERMSENSKTVSKLAKDYAKFIEESEVDEEDE